MADTITNDATSLTKYVTILDLREQWLKKQQQEQQEVENRVKEKVQGAGDAGLEESPQFQNPKNLTGETKTHKGEIGEIKFRRNPNRNNRRPFRRNFDGENRFIKKVNDSRVEAPEIVDGVKVAAKIDAPQKLKASKGDVAVDVKNTTQETTEIDVGAVVEADSNAIGKLKDAKTVKKERKKLNNNLRKKLWKERKRNRRIAEKEGQTENVVSEERNSVPKERQEGVEDEEKMKEIIWVEKRVVGEEKRNVSKIGGSGEKKKKKKKMGKGGNSRAVEIRGKMEDVTLLENPIPVAENHFVIEKGKCGECKEEKSAKMKDVSVSKEKQNVSKNGEFGEKTVVGHNNQECLNDLAVEIEGKLKEILLLEEQIPATEKQNEHQEKENVRKNGEMRRGDHRARAERKFGGSVRGRWHGGEGGRRMSGLIWVKKSQVSG